MPHNLRVRSKSNSENEYRIEVNGGIEPESGIGGRDRVTDGGTACEGRVVSGVDAWTYWGAKGPIEASDPDDLQLSINHGEWKPAAEFGATTIDDGGIVDDIVDTVTGDPSTGTGAWGGTSRADRKAAATASHGSGEFHDLSTGDTAAEYRALVESVDFPLDTDHYAIVPNGTHETGTVQTTLATHGGDPALRIVGNPANPYACRLTGNHNFVHLAKDEHLHLEGLTLGRTQFAGTGDPMIRNCVFTDMRRPDNASAARSSVGGKRACGRFIGCEFGHRNDPDELAAMYYGGGSVHIDHGNTLRATGECYIGVNNTATVYIGENNDFESGEKEVVEGSGVYPDDLHGGINVFDAGHKVA